jgi:hypothetical protein
MWGAFGVASALAAFATRALLASFADSDFLESVPAQ